VRSRSVGSVVCAVCGSRTARSTAFCPRCGSYLAATPSREPAEPPRGHRRGWAAGLAVLCLAAAAVIVGIRGDGPPPAEPLAGPSAGGAGRDAVLVPAPADTADGPDVPDVPDPSAPLRSTDRCAAAVQGPCALQVLDGGPHVAAVRVGFGAIVVDEHLTVRRVRVDRDEAAVTWSRSLGLPADPAERRGAPIALTRSGEVAFVGTRTHLHAVEVEGGERRWSVALRQAAGASHPWSAWQVDDAVLATAGSTLVALDPVKASLRWSRSVAGGTVARLSSGAAVVAPGRLEVVAPEQRRPQWRLELPAGVDAVAGDAHRPVSGPLVLTGTRSLVVDVEGRRVLADLGTRAVATSLANGHAVAVVWEEDGDGSVLLGWGPDGREHLRQPGPPVPCCDVRLHERYDGRVLVVAPAEPAGPDGSAGSAAPAESAAHAGPGEVAGWVVDPTDGRILQWVRRPDDVVGQAVTVARGVAVWWDGRAHVGTDATTGRDVWRAPEDAAVLLDGPVLLATRDGLVRP
jgi:hypothetical protein